MSAFSSSAFLGFSGSLAFSLGGVTLAGLGTSFTGAEGGSGGQVGSNVGGGGNAPPAYADKVRRKIKPLIVFNPESITGNPAVIVLVDLAPDGAILKRSVLTSSGIQSWDQAVLQALDRAETFPKDDNGVIPMRQMKLTFKPKD